MPCNLDAERAVIGAVIYDPSCLDMILDLVKPDDFFDTAHTAIYRAMLALESEGVHIDIISLIDRLTREGSLEKCGGEVRIASLADNIATTTGVDFWAGQVAEKAALRRVILEADAVKATALSGPESVEEFLDDCAERFGHTADDRAGDHFSAMPGLLSDTIADLEKAAQNKKLLTGVPSGYSKLDRLTSGFQAGELVILAARPGMGKSALALNLARTATRDSDRVVAFFSLEMNKKSLMLRLLAMESRLDQTSMRTGYLTGPDWDRIHEISPRLSKAQILIDDSASLSPLEIKARSRRLKRARGRLDLVIVDYLQLLKPLERKRFQSREQDVSEISRTLKALAKDLQVPVICLSQLNRKIEDRQNEPRLSDLRESGAIEQDSDICLFLWQPPDKKDTMELEMVIGKNRNGAVGRLHLIFLKQSGRFENMEGE